MLALFIETIKQRGGYLTTKKMRLTNRDIYTLKMLDKVRVLDIPTAVICCGFTRENKCRDRFAILTKAGYIQYEQDSIISKRYYSIAQKGMNCLFPPVFRNGRWREKKPPKLVKANINHELFVAKLLAKVLNDTPDLQLDEIVTDRDLLKQTNWKELKYGNNINHLCDLYIEKYRVKIEVELNLKKITRLMKNIRSNGKDYMQVWICGNKTILYKIEDFIKVNPSFNIKVILATELEDQIIDCKELYQDFLNRNPDFLKEMEYIEELRRRKAEQMKMDI